MPQGLTLEPNFLVCEFGDCVLHLFCKLLCLGLDLKGLLQIKKG
jgi:hypothetical protein